MARKRDLERVGFGLYLITDRKIFPDRTSFFEAVEKALRAGVRGLQLREKDLPIRELLDYAQRFRELTQRYGCRLIINDRLDVALAVDADGLHISGTSIPAWAARKVAPGMLIGVSTHSVQEAVAAEKEDADFVTIGPVYDTPSKKEYGLPAGPGILREAKKEVSIPVFALGGVTAARFAEVREYGADGVAMISAILAADNIRSATEECMRALK